jgi:hypothetical protein
VEEVGRPPGLSVDADNSEDPIRSCMRGQLIRCIAHSRHVRLLTGGGVAFHVGLREVVAFE